MPSHICAFYYYEAPVNVNNFIGTRHRYEVDISDIRYGK